VAGSSFIRRFTGSSADSGPSTPQKTLCLQGFHQLVLGWPQMNADKNREETFIQSGHNRVPVGASVFPALPFLLIVHLRLNGIVPARMGVDIHKAKKKSGLLIPLK
jgi:hypothetical protein